MILTLGSVIADIGYAQYPQDPNTELVQASDRSATGVLYVEDFSLQINSTTYRFVDMGESEYIALMEFFVNDAQGKLNPFTLTDDSGQTGNVRFLESMLSFSNSAYKLWNGSFSVEST